MAIADMFLKVQGVTGESVDTEHKGEIEVVSWSWGMQASVSTATGESRGRSTITEIEIVKRVDQSSPTLMTFLKANKPVPQARLVVRKAGQTPLEYLTVEMTDVRITSVKVESVSAELVERVRLGFAKVRLSYVPQDAKGGRGAANTFEADVYTAAS